MAALRTVQPRKPKTPIPAPGSRYASPTTGPTKSGLLGSLTNLATISGGSPPASVGAGGGDQGSVAPWESDPVLQQIKAIQQSNVAVADAQAAAAKQQALINFGYSDQLAGLYGDQGTAAAAQANPFSVLKELEQTHNLRQRNLNETLNKANLFYSSTRADQLGQEGQQYLGEQYRAGQNLQSTLAGLSNADTAAHQAAQGAIGQGETEAYDRYLKNQLQYGLGAGGGTVSGALRAATRAPALARPRVPIRRAVP